MVASYAEAWIETIYHLFFTIYNFVASYAEAWIETRAKLQLQLRNRSRLLRRGVD